MGRPSISLHIYGIGDTIMKHPILSFKLKNAILPAIFCVFLACLVLFSKSNLQAASMRACSLGE